MAGLTYEEIKARQKSRALYNSVIKNLKQRNEPNMDNYELSFKTRRFESIYGTAYPFLKPIDQWTKRKILANLIQSVGIDNPSINIELNDGNVSTLFMKKYDISIRQNGKRGYDSAVATEKWIRSIPRLGMLSPPRFWNRLIPGRRPSDSFMINDLAANEVYTWLRTHCEPRDYQMYTKFREDVSLGFRNPEHATLFKLTFGDKNI